MAVLAAVKAKQANFVFVVFKDPAVVGAIRFVWSALNEGNATYDPHLTIQGPFADPVKPEQMDSIKRRLAQDEFFIGNPGTFATKKGIALFLRVNSENLLRVWNKPDYPVEKYGFNPHLTLYEGRDESLVTAALNVLKRERFELICRSFDVVPYVSKQEQLFPRALPAGDDQAISKLIWSGKLSSAFRTRLLAATGASRDRRSQ